jgi:thioredoxin 1
MAKILNVTDETFENEVLNANLPTLVDLWAAWCGPCKMIAPVVEAIADEYDGKLRVARLDVDSNRRTPGQFGVRGIPTLILFKDGAEVARLVGFRAKDTVIEELLQHI